MAVLWLSVPCSRRRVTVDGARYEIISMAGKRVTVVTSPFEGAINIGAGFHVRSWHEPDLQRCPTRVRFRGQSGKHLLPASISPFDPSQTCGFTNRPNHLRCRGTIS